MHSQAQHRMVMGLSLVNFANPATELLQVRTVRRSLLPANVLHQCGAL
jgi:hypothetical protein